MNRLQEELTRACTQLGLRVELDFVLHMPTGVTLTAAARLPELGAPNGMIVVPRFEDIGNAAESLVASGYGYSVLSEPYPGEPFDLESYIEMFSDWGWARGTDEKPGWMS